VSAASEITRKAKSNLAFALKILPPAQRQDMVVFYAYCRTMDDLADDPTLPIAEKSQRLTAWKLGILHGFEQPDAFQRDVVSLRDRHQIPNELLTAIIDGCEMDLTPRRYQSWEDLSSYTWKVACAVGLVSIRLFGCRDSGAERYAIALGHALQLTNILRDVGEDFANDRRIYLPLDDFRHFGYTEDDLANQVRDSRFIAMMSHQADRAAQFYRDASASLPVNDRKALTPARIMAEVYLQLLHNMQSDGFNVFEKRYQLSTARKVFILAKHLIA
jgi:phytoene synthase